MIEGTRPRDHVSDVELAGKPLRRRPVRPTVRRGPRPSLVACETRNTSSTIPLPPCCLRADDVLRAAQHAGPARRAPPVALATVKRSLALRVCKTWVAIAPRRGGRPSRLSWDVLLGRRRSSGRMSRGNSRLRPFCPALGARTRSRPVGPLGLILLDARAALETATPLSSSPGSLSCQRSKRRLVALRSRRSGRRASSTYRACRRPRRNPSPASDRGCRGGSPDAASGGGGGPGAPARRCRRC